MDIIDISTIKEKNKRTILLFLNKIFDCVFYPSDEDVYDFIHTYIPEMEDDIIRWTQNDMNKLRDIKFVTEAMNNYDKKIKEQLSEIKLQGENVKKMFEEIQRDKEKFDLSTVVCNLCVILVLIEKQNKMNDELFQWVELDDYDEVRKILNHKVEGLIAIISGVFNYITEIFNYDFDSDMPYNVVPDIHHNIQQQKNIQAYKKYYTKGESHNCYVSDILLFFELIIVNHKVDIIKMLLSLICINKSIEYDDVLRDYAKTLIGTVQEIMYCGEVHRVYIQMKNTNTSIPIEERGSNDATTRFSIIFSMNNEDILLLRIDLPHKGENKLHINLQECVKDTILETGYPIRDTIENRKELESLTDNNFEELFFCMNNQIWFRSEFLKKIEKIPLDNKNKEAIEKIFHDRCHYSIDFGYGCEEKYIEFTNELRDYFISFNLSTNIMRSFDKDSLNIEKEFFYVRKQQCVLNKLMEVYKQTKDCSVNGNELLWSIWGESEQLQYTSKEDFLGLDLAECWKLIAV